ncbi:hypothetical protein FACS1894198_2080 [Clostridia bacterium]|nr:hypothetical protein FACS1894198_2080 [Clostridia bacterium]
MGLPFSSPLVSQGLLQGVADSVIGDVGQDTSHWLQAQAAWDRALFDAKREWNSDAEVNNVGDVDGLQNGVLGADEGVFKLDSDVEVGAAVESSASGSDGIFESVKGIYENVAAGERERLQNGWNAMTGHGDISVMQLATEFRKRIIGIQLAKMYTDKGVGAVKEIFSMSI